MKPGILTLTTDFGIGGPYVAAMKGVLLGLAPETQIVDVCHTISPQNVLEGAFVLAGIVDAFPHGTVHLAVVDPGVGIDRRLVAARLARMRPYRMPIQVSGNRSACGVLKSTFGWISNSSRLMSG